MSLPRPYARLLHIAFEDAWRGDSDDPHRCAECGLRVWTSTHRGAYGGMDALTWHRRGWRADSGWMRGRSGAIERADDCERARQAGYVTAQMLRPWSMSRD
jgi:hypothetical protein